MKLTRWSYSSCKCPSINVAINMDCEIHNNFKEKNYSKLWIAARPKFSCPQGIRTLSVMLSTLSLENLKALGYY